MRHGVLHRGGLPIVQACFDIKQVQQGAAMRWLPDLALFPLNDKYEVNHSHCAPSDPTTQPGSHVLELRGRCWQLAAPERLHRNALEFFECSDITCTTCRVIRDCNDFRCRLENRPDVVRGMVENYELGNFE